MRQTVNEAVRRLVGRRHGARARARYERAFMRFPHTLIEADALFADVDTCSNPEAGYTVEFPEDWYTNTAVGDVPACSWFTPEFFTLDGDGQTPDEIWLSIVVIDGRLGSTGLTVGYFNEDVTVSGLQAHREEVNPRPNEEPTYRIYRYVVPLESDSDGPTLLASIDTASADDYELGKAVLDRMMASLRISDSP